MRLKRILLIAVTLGFLGTVGASELNTNNLCPACTNYCKLHPNSPRCL